MPHIKRERDEDYEDRESDYDGSDDKEQEDIQPGSECPEEPVTDDDAARPAGSNRTPVFFAKGSVKLVKVHDFMTYNGTVVIRPGPRLNLVLGPNGTGKSSFVCALCLGLNGSQKTLGRADDIKEYVRKGASSFWTEITLSSGGEGRDYVVRRTVSVRTERDADGQRRSRHESKWKINGADVSTKDVEKLVKRLNIQFDNLCQFLPQDKVAEFAKMNQYELLQATLMAVGDSSLYDQHQKLIQLRKDEKQETADRIAAQNRLVKLQAEQDRQRRDYERFQQREKLLAEARALQAQAKWLEVFAKGKIAEAAKQRMKVKREALKALEEQQEEQIRPIRAREEALKELKQHKLAADRQARDADSRMRRVGDKLNKHDADIAALADEMASLDQQAKDRASQIAGARTRLEKAQAELERAPGQPPQELFDRMQELRTMISTSQRESADVEAQRNQLALQINDIQGQIGQTLNRLNLLNSRKHQMLQRLANTHHNIGKLHAYVEQHRSDGTFQGPVFGPVALELSVKAVPGMSQMTALQYVENTCFKWLASYIVTDLRDADVLNREARSLGVAASVKVVATEFNPNQPFHMEHPAGEAAAHAGYGICHTVDELIDAAPVFMHFLMRQCHPNTVYIGTDATTPLLEDIARDTRIGTVLVGGMRNTIIRSHYNAGVRAIDHRDLHPVKLLAPGGGSEDDAERAALQSKERILSQERDRVQAEGAKLDHELQQRDQQRQSWGAEIQLLQAQRQSIIQKRTTLNAAVGTAQRYLRQKEAIPDPEQRRPELRRQIEDKIAEVASMSQQVLAAARELWIALRTSEVLELRLTEATAQLQALRSSRERREEALHIARNEAAAAEQAYKSAGNDFKLAKDNAAEHFPLTDEDKEEMRRHEAERTNPSVLRSAAEAKVAEAEQVVCNNQNVMHEFRKRQADIAQLTESVECHEARCNELRNQIEEIKGMWLPDIREMVHTINASFSTNFMEIGCAGEVRLHEDEDFEKFAIQILVQFRVQEEMQLLTGTRQSGGERSVSTILYLIALQGVTETPFRVVDEINQGMDPVNERKVYKQLVAASTEEHTPQCFLLTPKLLSGLEYTPDIHTLIIYSSAEMQEGLPAVFTTDDICG